MVRPARRRLADPQIVQKLWGAVNYTRQQKQIPNIERVARYMQREHEMEGDVVELQLQYAVKDGLILSYKAVGFKGSKTGIEQEGFKVPDTAVESGRDSHDWYCFECHQPGEVLTCSDCWRVYHPQCTREDYSTPQFTCHICKDHQAMRRKGRIKRKELNRLLGYTVIRLKEKVPTRELHRLGYKEEEDRYKSLLYMPMDLNTMEAKAKNRRYKYVEQFQGDAQIVLHNTLICYGESGTMAELANIMIRDCKYDLDEIRQCKDCYHYSNAKPKDWFCQPCTPAHDLVYAKQKGFSYWPAKVIKVTEEGYDVRFFGGWHQRALVPTTSVKPITSNLRSLGIKRTAGFVKASKELELHQRLNEKQAAEAEGMTEGTEGEGEEEEEEEEEPKKKKRKKSTAEPKAPPKEETEEEEKEEEPEEQDNSMEVISSSNVVPDKPAPTPEDSNLVTSSEDNIQSPKIVTVDTATQTSKKMGQSTPKMPNKYIQTDTEIAKTSCDCETKYTKIFSDFKERLEQDHKEEKDKALQDLSDSLRKDFEEDKQQAVARALNNTQREIERVRQQTEERCKQQYMEEMKKLAAKHKEAISSTKKKQWCYNCEEEAMYHCCWNTSYCSIKCQQEHWHREHKRVCRRKR